MNMHHLAPEGVIPETTIEEHVITLRRGTAVEARDVDFEDFKDALYDENAAALTLSQALKLPDGETLGIGLHVHGRLVDRGHIRREYWKMGKRRITRWQTQEFRHGRWQVEDQLDEPEHVGECETFANLIQIEEELNASGQVMIVLRRGVSYAEVCNTGLAVDDFISHNWAEPTRQLIKTLMRANVGNCWICTFAVNQHMVELAACEDEDESQWYRYVPFFKALESLQLTNGRVTMVLDDDVTVLTRVRTNYNKVTNGNFKPSGGVQGNFWRSFCTLVCTDGSGASSRLGSRQRSTSSFV